MRRLTPALLAIDSGGCSRRGLPRARKRLR